MATAVAAAEGERVLATAAGAQPVLLAGAPGGAPLRIVLAPPPAAGDRDLVQALQSAGPRDQFYLSLQGLRIERPVTAVFDVYFGLPAGAAPSPANPYYVGDFNFFDVQSGRKSAVFNVSDKVRALLGKEQLSDQAVVTIVAKSEAGAAARPSIGKVELLAVAP